MLWTEIAEGFRCGLGSHRMFCAVVMEMQTVVVAMDAPGQMEEPRCLRWSCRDVGGWIRRKGFPQYEVCFTDNAITGNKLIHITCSTLPQIGVTDYDDMKAIAQLVRDLLEVTEPSWGRSISLPRRDNMGLYLEQKSQTGANKDLLTYNQFIKEQDL